MPARVTAGPWLSIRTVWEPVAQLPTWSQDGPLVTVVVPWALTGGAAGPVRTPDASSEAAQASSSGEVHQPTPPRVTSAGREGTPYTVGAVTSLGTVNAALGPEGSDSPIRFRAVTVTVMLEP